MVDFNPANYETKQVFYSSKDGTQVPMFITYKKRVFSSMGIIPHIYTPMEGSISP